MSCCRFLAFSHSILILVQNDWGRQGVIMRKASVVILNEREGSITVVRKTADETVTQSKEFITFMASYRLPVIQSFGKNVL